MPTVHHAKPLAELLLEKSLLTEAQLKQAQAQAARLGAPLQRVLIQQRLVPEQALTDLLAEQHGMAVVDVSSHAIKPEVVALVPEPLARKHLVMPLLRIADTLTVAIADPLNFVALDEVRLKSKCLIKAVLANPSVIERAISRYYGTTGTVREVAAAVEEAHQVTTTEVSQAIEAAQQLQVRAEDAAHEAPIIRLVNLLVLQAMKEGASDIHLEPGEQTLRTRLRIDGVLHEVGGPTKPLHPAVVSRIKVLANLDIAEKRVPQDGRFQLALDGQSIDVRVSTIPAHHGEKVVMRLLDRSSTLLTLEQLGCGPEVFGEFQRLIRAPHGILLVTGPTGSGKTTTLYAALNAINSVEKNITTIEDPIEYQLPGINQVQVNVKAGVTFASALRAFLRQDPNVIMVGEIRDVDTMEIAIQAALTGHLVFSTLHTNDAPTGLTRLLDMGMEPFLITSAVIGILGQRLVRVICHNCKTGYRPSELMLRELGLSGGEEFFHGRGCEACRQTGYKGRLGIFELLALSEPIKELVIARAASHQIRAAAAKLRMKMMREDGLEKARKGITTLEEVLRVTQLE